ncbi:MAG: (Fe-S)-binding protein [Actinomycetota bacterium]
MSPTTPATPDVPGSTPTERLVETAVVLGTELPAGARFVGPEMQTTSDWRPGDAPATGDLDACVACGLCLPHCPTYRLTGEESASPRGRITAMRAVDEGLASPDATFAGFMDLCLVCRACEDVCPSHVPFGRMMERARTQIEPDRPARSRLLRWFGLDIALPRRWLLSLAMTLTPLVRPLLPRRVRALAPRGVRRGQRVPATTEPVPGIEPRGTVAILTGCVQDQWFREVNRATARVLALNGWRVVAPRAQRCCGALPAHNGRLDTARTLARDTLATFADVDALVVNAAGCGAHLKDLADLFPVGTDDRARAEELAGRTHDLMEFLAASRLAPPDRNPDVERVAYHDACHALRAQGIERQPREVLAAIPGLEIVDLPGNDRCCGAAGLYNVLEPEMSGDLRREKGDAIAATGVTVVASANPGCAMQLSAAARERGMTVSILHPVELLDRAYARR